MNRPPRRWAEQIYGLVVALYPKTFRERYGPAMRLVFQDLLHDPEMPLWRIWFSVLRDLRGSFLHEHLANLTGGLSMSAVAQDDSRTLRARRIAGARYGFRWHLPMYVIFNTGFVMIWLLGLDGPQPGEHFPWPLFPIFFWGIGLVSHYVGAYRTNTGRRGSNGWIERETQKILAEETSQSPIARA
jgi:2TM domain-containing protein